MSEEKTACQKARELREGALPYWRPLWEARREELNFLDGDRYENDSGAYNRDRRAHQIRGQELSNVGRNKAAQATAAPRVIEALPVDQFSDPDDAEIAVSLLEWELNNPLKGFDQTLDEVVQDAVDARVGCMMLDFDPDLGRWGETFWRWKDPNLIMFEPGFSSPHHIACGWMMETRRMPLSRIKAMGKLKGKARWHGVEGIVGDSTAISGLPGEPSTEPITRLGVPGATVDDDHAWVHFCWYKNDEDTYSRVREEREIPENERYMGCDNPQCPYRSKTVGALREEGLLGEKESLPDEMEPCPMCNGHLSRRDIHANIEEVLAYPNGRRLVIFPALQTTPDDEPFYDGEWPVPTARSFPIMWLAVYVRVGRPMGDSDTTRNWDAQIASDQLLTMAFDRIMRHQTYYGLPSVGVTDVHGRRFQFRDDQKNILIYDWSDPNRPQPRVDVIQGAALDPAFGAYWDRVQRMLLGPQGINDMGLTQESSKAIAASTVAQLDRIGNIPVQHLVRRKNRALSEAYGVHWDYLRATIPAERLARLQMGDEPIVGPLRGDELPNFDFVVTESPPFTGLEKARAEAAAALFQIADQRPERIEVFAEINQFPPSIVRKVRRQLARERQAAQAAAMPPTPPLPGGFPSPPAPPAGPFQNQGGIQLPRAPAIAPAA